VPTRPTVPPELLGLSLLFLAAATLYASVGFGGGSAYLALLALAGFPLPLVAVLALVCNVIVVAGGSWHFARAGHLEPRLVIPLLVTSVPAAYLGGRAQLDDGVLRLVMGGALLLAALAMAGGLVRRPAGEGREEVRRPGVRGGLLGGAIGGVSGMVGIGGGVFLAPALHFLRWGGAKQIAATASLFILLNSLAGLAGKLAWLDSPGSLLPYAPLLVAVFVGGQIGSRLGAWRLEARVVRQVTAGVVGIAALQLLLGG
jgi:uncharacterized protein